MSTRIEALDAGDGIWVQVESLELPVPGRGAALNVRVHDSLVRHRLLLSRLMTPFPSIQARLRAMDLRAQAAYLREAAEALRLTKMPIRVRLAADGQLARDVELFNLRSTDAAHQVRVMLRWNEKTWVTHLGKHLVGGDAQRDFVDHLLTHAARTLGDDWSYPVRSRVLRNAILHASPVSPIWDTLPPAWWPLLEFYGSVSVELFRRMLHGTAVHVVRDAATFWLDEDRLIFFGAEGRLDPDEEGLYVAPLDGTLLIAKGRPPGPGPLGWATTHPSPSCGMRLSRDARDAARILGVTVRVHVP